jgi:Bacteriophage tail sheath protein
VTFPGYRVVDSPRTVAENGLRNDVAAFLGSTERGPLNVAVRVAGRQAYATVFGGPATGSVPRAVAAYYSNGGEVCWVVRAGLGGRAASSLLDLGQISADGGWTNDGPRRMSFPGTKLLLTASSVGTWATGCEVRIVYRAFGHTGAAEIDLTVQMPGIAAVRRTGLASDELLDALTSTGVITGGFIGPAVAARPDDPSGPAQLTWVTTLAGGAEPEMGSREISAAVGTQAQIEEIAMVCIPDLAELLSKDAVDDVLSEVASSAAATQDRLVVVSVPATDAQTVLEWSDRIGGLVPDPAQRRAVAAYFPYLLAERLTPSGPDRYQRTDPVGHVCGRIAELDRERGSGWSPANTLVRDAIDVGVPLPARLQTLALDRRINLVRGRAGGGLELWGARTMDVGDGCYVAHRRLVHRIVRGARRVVEPLVFDTNDRLLWFAVGRAISGILMEAFRTGALQGATPDEAYRVRCDEHTNPQDVIDAGQVVCEIDLAPAAPMEFITLRLTIGAEGLLEVVEQ